MPVVLSGDVHHRIPSADRRHAPETESAMAVEYAGIAQSYGLKVTLFFTGRAVRDDAADARPLLSLPSVEIGGHGWDAFHPRWLYGPLRRLSGSAHGPQEWQRRTIARTCAAIDRFAGRPPRSWRDHAYLHDRHTPWFLADAGIAAWSDDVDPARAHPYRHESGLVVLPLNTTPDHENLYHGDRTPETLGSHVALTGMEWRERVLAEVELAHAQSGVATIMAHPFCMKIVDDWETFDALCAGLAKYPTLLAAEAAEEFSSAANM